MPRKSESLRLLERMDSAGLRRFAEHHEVGRARSMSELRRRLVGRLGTSLDALVSLHGPWSRDEWNELLKGLGGEPQPTFEALRHEMRRVLHAEPVITSMTKPPPPDPQPKRGQPQPEKGAIINGRYVLLDRLGAGGFGTVFSARDCLTEEDDLVLKFANDPDRAESVLNEYRKASRLHHPNICHYQHYDRSADYRPFVVMRNGGTSVAKLAESRGLHLPDALSILHDAAKALDFAHAHGVIHGDVNPGNVLVGKKGLVQLTDFGIAAFTMSVLGTGGRQTVVGTRIQGFHQLFGAPEIRYGTLKPQSDQYSLALVFCAAVRGMGRFQGPELLEDALSSTQQRVMERALSSTCQSRFHSCLEFVDAMRGGARAGSRD